MNLVLSHKGQWLLVLNIPGSEDNSGSRDTSESVGRAFLKVG